MAYKSPPELPPRKYKTIAKTTSIHPNLSTTSGERETSASVGLLQSTQSLNKYGKPGLSRSVARSSPQIDVYNDNPYDESEIYDEPDNFNIATLPRTPSRYRSMAEIPLLTSEQSPIERNSFISPRIPLSDKDTRDGIFIKEGLHFSLEGWSCDVNELVRIYNTERLNPLKRQDLKKHILTKIVVDLKGKDIDKLSMLLCINSHSVKTSVAECLLEETLELQNTNQLEISSAIDTLIEVSQDGNINILLILFNLMCFAFINDYFDVNRKKKLCRRIQTIFKSCKDQTKIVQEAIELLSRFSKHYESSKENTQYVIDIEMQQKTFLSLNFFAQYNHVYALFSKLFTMPSNVCRYVDAILKVLAYIISKTDKTKQFKVKQSALLRLVVSSCVYLLRNDTHLDLQSDQFSKRLLDILDLIFKDSKVIQENRISLIQILEPLLLVENTHTVTRIHELFIMNCGLPLQMSKLVKDYISRELSHTGIKFVRDHASNEQSPVWQIIEGSFKHVDKDITMHCLMPSQRCLIKGMSTDFMSGSDKVKTKFHLNNLHTLRHLQVETTHSSVIQLLAYQLKPIPVFYIIENLSSLNSVTLNEYLLKKRRKTQWLTKESAARLALQVVDAVSYVHDKSVIHRDLTSHSFWICEGGSRLMLCDFSIALILDDNSKWKKDFLCEKLPALWTAPESILEDKFAIESDIWMLGHVFYEIFTHGCQPYTEMYIFSIDKILSYVVFHKLLPKAWPCIPKEVDALIKDMLQDNPEKREVMSDIQSRLKSYVESLNSETIKRSFSYSFLCEEDKMYPKLDPKQDKPIRGLPEMFKEFKNKSINAGDVIYNAYMNLKVNERSETKKLQVDISELTAADRPSVVLKDGFISVNEAVAASFIDSIRVNMTKDTYERVLCMNSSPTWSKYEQQIEFDYSLEYEMKCCTKLTELASSRQFGDPNIQINLMMYLDVVLKMVAFVVDMNERQWILGSIRCSDMYLTTDKEKVVMARLGRMKWIDKIGLDGDHIIADDQSFDSYRWSPIEVLQFSQYSFASDVYSLAMAIHEFFMTMSVNQDDPMAGELECAPFPYIAASDLKNHLFADGKPERPDVCPEWLYQLLCECWIRDSEKRPSCSSLYDKIQESININYSSNDVYEEVSDTDKNDQYEAVGDDPENIANQITEHDDPEDITEQYEDPEDIANRVTEHYDDPEVVPNQCERRKDIINQNKITQFNEDDEMYEDIIPFNCVNSDSESDEPEESDRKSPCEYHKKTVPISRYRSNHTKAKENTISQTVLKSELSGNFGESEKTSTNSVRQKTNPGGVNQKCNIDKDAPLTGKQTDSVMFTLEL